MKQTAAMDLRLIDFLCMIGLPEMNGIARARHSAASVPNDPDFNKTIGKITMKGDCPMRETRHNVFSFFVHITAKVKSYFRVSNKVKGITNHRIKQAFSDNYHKLDTHMANNNLLKKEWR